MAVTGGILAGVASLFGIISSTGMIRCKFLIIFLGMICLMNCLSFHSKLDG